MGFDDRGETHGSEGLEAQLLKISSTIHEASLDFRTIFSCGWMSRENNPVGVTLSVLDKEDSAIRVVELEIVERTDLKNWMRLQPEMIATGIKQKLSQLAPSTLKTGIILSIPGKDPIHARNSIEVLSRLATVNMLGTIGVAILGQKTSSSLKQGIPSFLDPEIQDALDLEA